MSQEIVTITTASKTGDSDYGTRQEQFTLNAAKLVAWAAVAIGALATIAWLSASQYTQLLATNIFLVPLAVACALCHVLYRRGYATAGFYVFLSAALLTSWGTFFLLPEMMLASLVGYTVVVTISFLLLGDRGGMGMVLVSMLLLAVDAILVEFVTPELFTPLAETPALIVKIAFPTIAFPVIAGTIRYIVMGQREYSDQAQHMTARLRETVAVLQERSDELAERTHEMEASLRVTSAASERVSPDELLKLVVNLVRDQFHFYHVQVYTLESSSLGDETEGQRQAEGAGAGTFPPQRGVAVLRESTGYAGRRLLQQKHHLPLNRPSLVARAINEGQPVLVRDVSQDQNYLPNPLLPDTRSELVVPLKIGERVIGALDVQARELDRFTPSLVALFQTLVGQIVFLLENSELVQRVTEQGAEMAVFTDQLRTAAEIAQQLGAILDPERLLQEMVSLLQSRFGLYHAHVYVLDEKARTLTLRAGSGEVGRVLVERGHGIPLDREKSLVARAARKGQTVVVADTALDSDFMPNPLLPQTRSEIAVPLIVGDRALGVLDVQDDRPNRFTPADVDTFGTLAGQVATALQNAGLFAATQARLHVSQALAVAQTEEEVLDAMIQVADFYPQAMVVIFTLDQEADEITALLRRFDVLESGIMPAGAIGARYTASQFTLLGLISADAPFVSADFLNDERVDPATRALIERLGATSVCILPITVGDEWLGILVGESKRTGFFDARRIHLYDSLAEQGAIALRTARLSDQVTESLQETRARLRVSQALAGAQTEDEVLDAMIQVADSYPQARVTIMMIDRDADELAATLCRAEAFDSGLTGQIPLGTRFTASLMPLFQHISPHTSFMSPNISLDERADPQTRQLLSQQGTASFAILPITAGEEWLGIFTASTREENFFDERKLYLYQTLTDLGAPALQAARLRAEVRESEARFRDVALSMSDWVWEVDAQGRYTYASDKVVEVLGYTAEEMLGKTPFDVMRPEEAARVGEVFGEIVANKRPIVEMENWTVAKDGREVCMLSDGVPLLDSEGNLIGYRGVDKDITERKQLNEISRGLNAARDEDELLEVLLRPAIQAGADQAYLDFVLLDEAGEPEWIEVVANWQKEGQALYPVGTRLYLPEFPYTKLWLYDPERPLIIANLDTDERLGPEERDSFTQINVQALVIVPLTQAGRWVGLLPIFWSEPHAHSETETALYNALPALATPALANRRLLIEQERALTETLYRISSGLNKASDAGEQLHVLARPAIDAGMSTANLLYIDLDQDDGLEWAEIVACWQREGEPPMSVGSRFYLPEFPFTDLWVASPDKAQLIADVTADERVDENTGSVLAQSGTCALVTVPLIQAGRWVGLVTFGWPEPHEFNEQETEVYNALVGLASPAVASRRLMGDLERMVSKRTEQIRTASDIAGQVNAILEPERLLHEVVNQLHERFGLSHVHAYLLDEETCELVMHAGSGEVGQTMLESGYRFSLDRQGSAVARAVRERELVLITDTHAEADFVPNPLLPDTRSIVAVPLVVGDKTLGVFNIQDDHLDHFGPSVLNVLSTLAGQVATALQNAAFVEEIQDIAAQLRQADRLKSDFLSSMSHEIRTPLNSIIGFAEVLLMGISGDLPPGVEEDIQAIFDNGQNLLKIINDILDLAKIESGTLTLHPETIEIAPLLEEVKANNAGLLVDKLVEMLIQVEDDLPTLEADPVRVHQVLNNLVSNAVKFTAEGTITLRAFRQDDWLCLEVQDSGIGISEEDLSRIFDRFEQAGDAMSRAKGTGLGLSIVRQLVEMHGGKVEARSTLGQGSTFSVHLPITGQ
jgi:PAS domain S-box-containing protein